MAKAVKKASVRYHVIADYTANITGASDEEIAEKAENMEELRKLRYSLVSLCPHPGRNSIFVGTTQRSHDLLVEFDVKTEQFRSCKYERVSGEHEVKIHRGLWLEEKENALYFSTSTLSPLWKIISTHGKGAPLVRYRIDDDAFDLLAYPAEGVYNQATNYDPGRKLLYYFGIPGLWFGVYDLKRERVLKHVLVESIPHISAIDDDGGVWGTWSDWAHAFFRYDPETNDLNFFNGEFAMPSAQRAANIMYRGAGPIDTMLNGGDGFLYIGTALGELYRLDHRGPKLEFLGKPHSELRMQGLCVGPDGALYGAGGRRDTFFFRYDRKTRRFDVLSDLIAPDGKRCTYPHDICFHGGKFYIAETDNPTRSGYLWEITL